MSKWIWLGLFVVTLFGIVWFGTRPKSKNLVVDAPKTETTGPVIADDSYQMAVPNTPLIPMTPELVRPLEPNPYTDVPPDVNAPDHPEYVPPPLSEGEFEPQFDPNNPPPQQAFPGNPPPVAEDGQYFNNGEPLPEYLRPPPGTPLDGGDVEGLPDPGPVDEGY